MAREDLPDDIRAHLMDEDRMAEIAIMLLKHEYARFGTQMFIAQLKVAAIDLGIDDDEMLKFFKSIVFDLAAAAEAKQKTTMV